MAELVLGLVALWLLVRVLTPLQRRLEAWLLRILSGRAKDYVDPEVVDRRDDRRKR